MGKLTTMGVTNVPVTARSWWNLPNNLTPLHTPISSFNSRKAAFSGLSPSSWCPPGKEI